MTDTVLFWLSKTIFQGREGEEDEGSGEGNHSENDGEEGSEEENDDSEGSGDGDEGDEDSEEDVAALRAAIKKERQKAKDERRLRRKAERDARQKKQTEADQAEEKDLKKAQDRATQSETKVAKMADKLLKSEVRTAILNAARDEGFIDPTDALTDDIFSKVDADQDDDDPSDIDIDEDSVIDAVKALAAKKKHLIGKPNDGESTGSRRRKKGGKGDQIDDKTLDEHYHI